MGDVKVLDAELQQKGDERLSCLQRPNGDEIRATQDWTASSLKNTLSYKDAHTHDTYCALLAVFAKRNKLKIKGHNDIGPACVRAYVWRSFKRYDLLWV